MTRFFVLDASILVLMLGACSPTASATQAVQGTLRPTLAASPSNTLTSTALPTYTLTSTLVPTETPTSTASATMPSFVIRPVFPTPTTAARLSTLPPEPTHTSTPVYVSATIETSIPESDTPTLTPTLACEGATASAVLSASSENLKINDTVKVTVTVNNEGCVALGLPQYRLYIQSDPASIFSPDNPEPVVHGLAVGPGQSDSAEFDLTAVAGGQATLTASVSYEVHLGYPGPAYWDLTSTRAPLIINIAQ